jgi:predicted  nucleic acid-binding Zn-ribbon protein
VKHFVPRNFECLLLFQASGGDLKELEKELDELNQRDAKLKASINTMQEQIISEQRKLKTLQKNIKIDENALTKKQDEMDKVRSKSVVKSDDD